MYDNFKNIIIENNLLPISIIPPVLNINEKLNSNEIKDLHDLLDMCNGIILQGGDNFYNYDIEVIKYAIKKDIPILGICLGMQAMASINKFNLKFIDNHNSDKLYSHKIYINKNTKLYNILKKDIINVNSYHKECITNSGIYNTSALSNDNVIEAIEYNKNKFNIGLQFHPEKNYSDINMKKIFKFFFNIIKSDA